jgi:hypothetical protein
MIEKAVQVGPSGRISIFKDHQAAAGVLHEHGRRAVANPAGSNDASASLRDFISALASRGEGELISVGGHRGNKKRWPCDQDQRDEESNYIAITG